MLRKSLLALAALLALSWGAGASAQTPPPSPILPYFALGDSLAAGVGASDPATKGYVAQFAQRIWGPLSLPQDPTAHWNLGIPGETSTSMLAPDGQLRRAVAELDRRNKDDDPANDVRIITLDIGGNDILGTLQRPECTPDPGAQACQDILFQQVIPTLEENLKRILGALRKAAGPQVPILLLTLYNPFSGTGTPLDSLGDALLPKINEIYFHVAPTFDVQVVDIFPIFQGKGPQLTHIARLDIHPNDEGYRLMAEAMVAALTASAPTPTPLMALPTTGSGHGQGGDGRPLWPYLLLAGGVLLLIGSYRLRRA